MASSAGPRWHVAPAIAGWLVPGLGHVILGEKRRGVILALSIGLLWLSGLVIGGISVCDRKAHSAWFAGQVLVGPTLAVDYIHQRLKRRSSESSASIGSAGYQPSYGHMNEQGILYTALAGLLNLLAVMDVIYRDPLRPRSGTRDPVHPPAGRTVA